MLSIRMVETAMSPKPSTICPPDLSGRPFSLAVERRFASPPADLFEAWTERLDCWFAAPQSVLMCPEVNAPFFFETTHAGQAILTMAESCAWSPID